MSEREKKAKALFDQIAKRMCVVCERKSGKRDAHHVIPKQTLKKVIAARALDPVTVLWDLRNGICVCRSCHDNHENASRRIPRSKLPAAAKAFAAELGLTYVLDRLYRA